MANTHKHKHKNIKTKNKTRNQEDYELKKSNLSRLKDVKTFLIKCKKLHLYGIQTIDKKDYNLNKEAIQVIKGKFETYNKPIVIKSYKSYSPFLLNDLRIYNYLLKQKYENILQPLCIFSCNDDISKYENNIKNYIIPCETKSKDTTEMTFIIFDYLQYGNISNFIKVNKINHNKKNIIKGVILQYILSVYELGKKYNVIHGDLNSGNIFIIKTNDRSKTIFSTIENNDYLVQTNGYKPVIIDFGRSITISDVLCDYDIISGILITLPVIIKDLVSMKYRKIVYNYFDIIDEKIKFKDFYKHCIELFNNIEIE